MSARSGKQIAVAMTMRDERRFLAFLRTTADVQILALNSPSADHVWLNAFPPRRSQDRLSRGFVLWNRAFDWEPEIQTFQHGAWSTRTVRRSSSTCATPFLCLRAKPGGCSGRAA